MLLFVKILQSLNKIENNEENAGPAVWQLVINQRKVQLH